MENKAKSNYSKPMQGNNLAELIDQWVFVLCNDGRTYYGVLKSFDQKLNVIMAKCQEAIYQVEQPAIIQEIGGFLIRGDTIALIGQIERDDIITKVQDN